MSKAILWIGGIFAPLGLTFAALGGWFYLQDRDLAASGTRASGTVIEMVSGRDSDGDYTSRPVVEYFDVEGNRRVFESRVASHPPRYSAGDRVEVIYPPGKPYDAVIDSVMDRLFLPLMFGGMGTLFAAIGGGLIFAWLRHRRIVAELRATGLPIQARFLESYRDTRVRVNGRHPFRVVAQAIHPATGKLHSFKSDAVWVDLTEQLAGRELRVWVDPNRPERHHVDLSPYLADSERG